MAISLFRNFFWKKLWPAFTEKDFKWFDPANGMGNYPIALYYKLMTGLKEEIDEEISKIYLNTPSVSPMRKKTYNKYEVCIHTWNKGSSLFYGK